MMLWLVTGTAAWGAGKKEWRLNLTQLTPLASVREAAQAAGVALDGREAPVARNDMQTGDTVTVLVSRTEGRNLQQWLIELTAAAPTAEEMKRPFETMSLYSSTGHDFTFGGGRSALNIRFIGPLTAADAGQRKARQPAVQQRRILISADYLGLGLDRVAVMLLRTAAARAASPKAVNTAVDFDDKPFPPAIIAASRSRGPALAADLTVDEEQAFCGGVLAMREFFITAMRTPGLQEVLRSVLDMPWWSLLLSGGHVDANFTSLPSAAEFPGPAWGLPASEQVYACSWLLKLNDKPALLVLMAVAAPKPPYLTSAGVMGLAACQPDGKGPVLNMQVVSARAAGPLAGTK